MYKQVDTFAFLAHDGDSDGHGSRIALMISPRDRNAPTLTVVNRWDEKAGLRTGCGVRSQVIDALEAQEIKETGNEEE